MNSLRQVAYSTLKNPVSYCFPVMPVYFAVFTSPVFYFPVPHVRQRGLFYGSNLGDSVPDVFKVFCAGTASSGNAILLHAMQNG